MLQATTWGCDGAKRVIESMLHKSLPPQKELIPPILPPFLIAPLGPPEEFCSTCATSRRRGGVAPDEGSAALAYRDPLTSIKAILLDEVSWMSWTSRPCGGFLPPDGGLRPFMGFLSSVTGQEKKTLASRTTVGGGGGARMVPAFRRTWPWVTQPSPTFFFQPCLLVLRCLSMCPSSLVEPSSLSRTVSTKASPGQIVAMSKDAASGHVLTTHTLQHPHCPHRPHFPCRWCSLSVFLQIGRALQH